MCFAGVAQYPSTAAVHSRCDGEDAARSVDRKVNGHQGTFHIAIWAIWVLFFHW